MASAQSRPQRITLDQAIDLALAHSPNLLAARTTIDQSKAQELTASLRPNPALNWDGLFVPVFSPSNLNANVIDTVSEFDLGMSYLFERGKKRQRRIDAARDATAITRYQVNDAERTLIFNVAQQFIQAQLAQSMLDFALKDLDSFEQTVRSQRRPIQGGRHQ